MAAGRLIDGLILSLNFAFCAIPFFTTFQFFIFRLFRPDPSKPKSGAKEQITETPGMKSGKALGPVALPLCARY
jgi:hypothetical protein